MRGKDELHGADSTCWRITPAYAGKSCTRISACPIRRDHPRLCGEKVELLETLEFPVGSPPPMRGKEHLSRLSVKSSGITPAYAGKSAKIGRCDGWR